MTTRMNRLLRLAVSEPGRRPSKIDNTPLGWREAWPLIAVLAVFAAIVLLALAGVFD